LARSCVDIAVRRRTAITGDVVYGDVLNVCVDTMVLDSHASDEG